MKFGTSDAGCYLYTDAETGSANGEIRAPARKSTLYIAALGAGNLSINRGNRRRGVDKNSRPFLIKHLPSLGMDPQIKSLQFQESE